DGDVVARQVPAAQRIDVGGAHLGIKRLPPEDAGSAEEVAARLREPGLHRNPGPTLDAEAVGDEAVHRDSVELRRAHRAPNRELPAHAQEQMPFEDAALD